MVPFTALQAFSLGSYGGIEKKVLTHFDGRVQNLQRHMFVKGKLREVTYIRSQKPASHLNLENSTLLKSRADGLQDDATIASSEIILI